MKNERGSVTLLAIIITLLLGLIGGSWLLLSKTDLEIAINHRDGIASQYVAEAGVQWAIAQLKTNSVFAEKTATQTYRVTTNIFNDMPTSGYYTVEIGPNTTTTDTNARLITSTGVVHQARRKITVKILLPYQRKTTLWGT
jgi:Tfp pilus assembly protein PilX